MSAGKLYNASAGCTCAPYFSFSFGFPFPSIQQVHLRRSVFQSHWMLHRGFTLSSLNSSYPRPQTELVALFRDELKQCWYLSGNSGYIINRGHNRWQCFCEGLCAQRLLIWFLLVFPGKTQSSGSEEKL